jgi:rhamnogalacturonyl hydrolase YesR
VTAEAFSGSLFRLQNYIEQENYFGYDPYDALKSPLFRLPFFKTSKLVRFGIQQLVKRSPVNLRPFLLIPKGLNPVTLGLCIQGYTELAISGDPSAIEKCNKLVKWLKELKSPGYHGACWGYDFPWEARHATIPAYQPTVVATGIITNALFQYYKLTKDQESFDLCRSACDFVLKDLKQTTDAHGSICFSYSPFDTMKVYNASMKGARILIQAYHVTKEAHLLLAAKRAVNYVISNQQPDGSWFYSEAKNGNWVDNYHTGYVLDCLHEYQQLSNDEQWNPIIEKGYSYYQEHLFEKGFKPKFFNTSAYPLDCTSAAQAILTLCRFNNANLASETAGYTIREMQSKKGYFYFRKYLYFIEKHSFMRWSNAWMFAALCTLYRKLSEKQG